jgi:class 3 adenylate cyclase
MKNAGIVFRRDTPSFFGARLLLSLSAVGTGYAAWRTTGITSIAVCALSAIFLAAYLYGFLAVWRNNIDWLRRLQRVLMQAGALLPEHKFVRNSAPWNTEKVTSAILADAVIHNKAMLQENVSMHQAMDAYLGRQASAHASNVNVSMTGSLRNLYILFCDLRGFTSMSEKLTPAETLQVLNSMFTTLEAVVADGGGEINKYIGDALLAYFKRPDENEEATAVKCARTAQSMQTRFQESFARQGLLKAKGVHLAGMGIGLVAGQALLGDLGSRNRHEFTLIGDSVNLSSRLCGVAPAGEVFMDETMARLVSGSFMVESRPPIHLKGISDMVTPYCLLDDISDFRRD